MTLDLSSLFQATIGFDHLNRILDEFTRSSQSNSYPPYNILKIDNNIYRLSIAIAGFSIEDIALVTLVYMTISLILLFLVKNKLNPQNI